MEASIAAYCIFCSTGQEKKLAESLWSAGYRALAPEVERWKPVSGGGVKKMLCPLLSGYVFFEAEGEPDWKQIYALTPVLKPLQYEDGARALRGADAEFVRWLKSYDGRIAISRVVQVGTKIEFVDGPLCSLKGSVIKVNKNRKQVQVAIGGEDGQIRPMWCSIEYIEANADTDKLRQA